MQQIIAIPLIAGVYFKGLGKKPPDLCYFIASGGFDFYVHGTEYDSKGAWIWTGKCSIELKLYRVHGRGSISEM